MRVPGGGPDTESRYCVRSDSVTCLRQGWLGVWPGDHAHRRKRFGEKTII